MLRSVLLTAEPYAFGPSSKMITIAKAIRGHCRVTILGRDIVHDYAAANGFSCEAYTLLDLDRQVPLLSAQDVALNVMNFELDGVFRKSGVPTFYLDTLFWFWDTPVWERSDPVRYFCQDFPGTHAAIANTKAPFRNRISVIGPVVDTSRRCKQSKPQHVLVNFGGLESDFVKIGSNSSYPFLVLDAILGEIQSRFDVPVIVTTRDSVAIRLQQRYSHFDRVTFAALSQGEFLDALSTSACVFTTPGVETVYEAFLHEIPVFFLPPSLNSQYYQLEVYKAAGVADFRLEWRALVGGGLERRGLSLSAQTEHILRTMRAPDSFEHLLRDVGPAMEAFKTCVDKPATQLVAQRVFMQRLGENGVAQICSSLMRS